jgi:hypothetical protein
MNVFAIPNCFLIAEEVPGVILGLATPSSFTDEQELRNTAFLDHRALNKPVELRWA